MNDIHDAQRLKELQALPLERKIGITAARITEWYQHWQGKVYACFSGGKDSTVLLHIARKLFPDIEAVFVDTGLEYPEIREFVKGYENVTWLKPAMRFDEVVKTVGWCFPSKDAAETVYYAKRGSNWAVKRLAGLNDDGNFSAYRQKYTKWAKLVDAPFLISHKCCLITKETPLYKHERETGNKPIVGMLADESDRRKQAWVKTGCNGFSNKRPLSKPLSFWMEQDILKYIEFYDIPIAKVYGNIICIDGKYRTTGEQRTGCMFCPVGCHLDKVNRFQRMAITHPRQYDYCMRPISEKGLGLAAVLDYIGVDYKPVIDNQIHMDIKI